MANMGNCFIKPKCGLHSGQGVSSLANPFGVASTDLLDVDVVNSLGFQEKRQHNLVVSFGIFALPLSQGLIRNDATYAAVSMRITTRQVRVLRWNANRHRGISTVPVKLDFLHANVVLSLGYSFALTPLLRPRRDR